MDTQKRPSNRVKANLVFVSIKCARCGGNFDTVQSFRTPECCIECYQCCVPVDCTECGKTFGAVDPNKHRHVNLVGITCNDCVFQHNMKVLG